MGQATVMMGRDWAGDQGSSYECQIRRRQKVLRLHPSALSPVWLTTETAREDLRRAQGELDGGRK